MRNIFYLMAVAFALMLFCVLHYPSLFSESLWPDEALYGWISQQFLIHPSSILTKEALAYQPPLYPIILSIGNLWGDGLVGYHAISLMIGMAGIVSIYLLGRVLVNDFVGAFAAIALSFNSHYFSNTGRILADIPLAVAIIIFMLALTNWVKGGFSPRHSLIVGVLGAAAILLKWPGALVIIPLFYCVLTMPLNCSIFNRLKLLFLPLAIMLAVSLLVIYLSCWRFGAMLPDTYVFQHAFVKQHVFFYLFNLIKLVGGIIPGVLLLIGLIAVLVLAELRHLKVLVVWVLGFILALSMAQEKQLRYAFILLPGCLLLAGVGADILIEKFFKVNLRGWVRSLVLMLLIFLGIVGLKSLILFQENRISTYTGFREASEWLSVNAQNAEIRVGSQRALRYYSGINFNKLPDTLTDLNQWGPGFIVVDFWEYTQPSWIYPLTGDKLDNLESAGLRLAKVIYRPIVGAQFPKPRLIPVIWIFEKKI